MSMDERIHEAELIYKSAKANCKEAMKHLKALKKQRVLEDFKELASQNVVVPNIFIVANPSASLVTNKVSMFAIALLENDGGSSLEYEMPIEALYEISKNFGIKKKRDIYIEELRNMYGIFKNRVRVNMFESVEYYNRALHFVFNPLSYMSIVMCMKQAGA